MSSMVPLSASGDFYNVAYPAASGSELLTLTASLTTALAMISAMSTSRVSPTASLTESAVGHWDDVALQVNGTFDANQSNIRDLKRRLYTSPLYRHWNSISKSLTS